MAIEDGRYVCCPLCDGKGQLHRSELTERINHPELEQRLREYLKQIKKDEAETLVSVGAPTQSAYEREMHSWPPKRMLWRRSPKE